QAFRLIFFRLKTAAFGGFVACLKRGAHFRDLTGRVKHLFVIFSCFFTDCCFVVQVAAFLYQLACFKAFC
ncbi:hypothetical protein, partial [Pseudidiomarina salilacus]|uniref:hypothetical protein n=1 Tax=Pseudidiomarina salilacus TaxID=3384452 RepID=UPI003985362F